jgi:hypothetical protein
VRKEKATETETKTKKRGRTSSKAAAPKKTDVVSTVEVTPEEVKVEEVAEEVVVVAEPEVKAEVKESKPGRKPRGTAKKENVVKEEKPVSAKREAKTSETITLQVDGREDLSMSTLIDRVKAAYVAEGHKAASIKNVEVYV